MLQLPAEALEAPQQCDDREEDEDHKGHKEGHNQSPSPAGTSHHPGTGSVDDIQHKDGVSESSGFYKSLPLESLQTLDGLSMQSLCANSSNHFGRIAQGSSKNHMLYRSIKPLIVDAVQIQEDTDVRTESGIVHAERGDWVIRDPQGNVIRCDDATFKSTYDRLSGWQGLESLLESKPCGC
jgi:hypothetical protein